MTERTTMTARAAKRVRTGVLGAGLTGALVLGSASIAQAATTPTASSSPSVSASTAAPTASPTASASPTPSASPSPTATTRGITSVITIKGKHAGTGTNFSGTYFVEKGSALVPAQSRVVDLQRKTPTGWATVTSDAADVNGNLVYGTVRSNFVQTWRLVTKAATTDPDYGVSPEFKVAQEGKAVTSLRFPTAGFRTGKHVAFDGYFTYRSWWITSGPDAGKQGFVAPLNARVYLQYLSGTTWKNKTSVLTEDRKDAGVNAYIDVYTVSSKPRVWRLYYPGSSTRTAVASASITK